MNWKNEVDTKIFLVFVRIFAEFTTNWTSFSLHEFSFLGHAPIILLSQNILLLCHYLWFFFKPFEYYLNLDLVKFIRKFSLLGHTHFRGFPLKLLFRQATPSKIFHQTIFHTIYKIFIRKPSFLGHAYFRTIQKLLIIALGHAHFLDFFVNFCTHGSYISFFNLKPIDNSQ
jgi:hypothetical protein